MIYDVHRRLAERGWIACDFYDGSVIYDFDRGVPHLVDLDNYQPGPFVNDMGRMFGSTRFMAPEEFTRGARIDERTTVFTMGRAAAVFLARHGDGDGVPGVVERASPRGSGGAVPHHGLLLRRRMSARGTAPGP